MVDFIIIFLVDNDVTSLSCACLVSLVLAWGNAAKMIAVATSFIADCSTQKIPLYLKVLIVCKLQLSRDIFCLKVPNLLVVFQRSVMGILIGSTKLPTLKKIGLSGSKRAKYWSHNLQGTK